ncbi:MAG: MBL fold metallo-hydrolase [Zoogloeaceae bacterium]|nr:MBL fold metallo-hydrolase [Zoogloeaceae bacterium]
MARVYSYPEGVYAVDAEYVRPLLVAVHLVVHRGRVAVVDTGAFNAVEPVMAALAGMGLGPEAVDWLFLTHVHLDHAGAAGALMARCPNARLAVHPRGLRHMVDPSKLWAGAAGVYGEEAVRALYGEPIPVAAERVVEATEGLELELAGRVFRFLDTPGHARHHVCIWDATSQGFFTGDTFGLSYRDLDVAGRPSIFPTTTPVQFEPEAMHGSIDRLLSFAPQAMYLTHFGRIQEVPRLAADLHRLIESHVAVARSVHNGPDRHHAIRAGLETLLREESRRQGWTLTETALFELFETDLELNAQGLGVWLDGQAKG